MLNRMNEELLLKQLQSLADRRGLVILEDPSAPGTYAMVVPDNAGKGTDPTGARAATSVFANKNASTLQEVSDYLNGRAF